MSREPFAPLAAANPSQPTSPRLSSLSLLVALALSGCAAQNAYEEGRVLAEEGRTEQALSKFQEAVGIEKNSARYRIAVRQAEEALTTQQLAAAEQAAQAGRLDEARDGFNQVLKTQSGNRRAAAGLQGLDALARHEQWLSSAMAALEKGDKTTAKTWTRMVLAENPNQGRARAIAQSIEATPELLVKGGNNALSEAFRTPITIGFRDASLKTIFEVLSRSSGLNFLFDREVRSDQKTSVFLKNSTVEAAVVLVLQTNQLEQQVLNSNTVLIYPNTQAKQKEYLPLTVKAFYLVNAEAKTVAATLKTILKSRDVVVDEKLNMIILRDSASAVRLAEKLVALHDVAEPEVMLEVEILEIKRTRLLDLGIRWPQQVSLSPLATAGGGLLTLADLPKLNRDTIGATVGPATINARKVDTTANILANPRIRARNREKAKILIGERVPNVTTTSTATGFVAESITYVDVGLKLDVEPTVYPDGEVAITIALEVSNIINQLRTQSGSIAYQIGTRTAQTVLRLKDGENQVLAGLINDEDRRTGNKVPALGEVPLLGRLFGQQVDDSSKTEIVLSITPRILRNIQRPSALAMEFESGTDASLGAQMGIDGTSRVATSAVVPTSTAPSHALPAGVSPTTNPPTAAASVPPQTPTNLPGTPTATPAVPNPGLGAVVPNNAALRWQGPTEARLGDTFALQLVMQSDQPIVSLPMAVGFDARLLQAVSVVEGDFLSQGGAQTSFNSRVDPSGQILITATRASATGAATAGTVATIQFKVIGAGGPQAQVQVLTAAPMAQGGRSVTTTLPAPQTIRVTP